MIPSKTCRFIPDLEAFSKGGALDQTPLPESDVEKNEQGKKTICNRLPASLNCDHGMVLKRLPGLEFDPGCTPSEKKPIESA